ncbi:MAG: DUF1540 domain-containing protein [Syntrophomonadaceae bacterium]|nr:DUF1540 domain-containing protein [Syntrophomonadaceae bacterium]
MDYQDHIKCTVSDCHYNVEKKYCKAPAIEVNVDNGQMTAGRAQATMCKTYKSS